MMLSLPLLLLLDNALSPDSHSDPDGTIGEQAAPMK
jgi:hypothetical protein